MKSTTHIVEITTQQNEKCLSEGKNLLACSPACLFASCQLRNFPREFTEKCFAVFDQSSCAIYLTWYRPLLFFWEFSSIIFLYHFKILVKSRGGGTFLSLASSVNVWQNFLFFSWKLNIPSFIFLIWTEQFWIWFCQKLTKKR